MRHLSYLAAAQEYENRTPAEAPHVVSLSGGATLAHLATVLDGNGIEGIRVAIRRGQYHVTADTRWASQEAVASDLATALQDAICAAVEAQRAVDAEDER